MKRSTEAFGSSGRRRNEKRKHYTKLLNARRWWGEVRVAQLREHPLCQMCEKEGIVTAAVDVHHIVPVQSVPLSLMESVCYDPKNLISLCIPCHKKIHRQMPGHHAMRPAPGLKDEKARSFIRKWAGEETLRDLDNRKEIYDARKLPRFLLTKQKRIERDRQEQEQWKKKMKERFATDAPAD